MLAHIAVLSKFYGVLTYKIGAGEIDDIGLLEKVHLRDVFGERLAGKPAGELVALARADHDQTARYLRIAAPAELRRTAADGMGGVLSAEEVARLALVSHLETHLDQLERALNRTG